MVSSSCRILLSWLKKVALIALSFICCFSLAQVSIAAESSNLADEILTEVETVPNHTGLDTSSISSGKISQFVQVYLKVVALIEQRESDLQAIETTSESSQMQYEIQTEALSLIEASGLTLQEYLQLLSLANIDPEFGERVAAQIQEATR
ncbi:MAG: DUF4168 domain-containing protein [Cyanobacteria bacterium CRU_2_1]|nr:DUF4168 domain-containing protein [Cyanobacteria bacterium RU_5_0]NJR57918.1 DUF4168 domain-containing protein [Cyanobacteria bacterium CRU_2_1]